MFTTAGGFRDFTGDSTFNVGEQNGVLYVWEDGTGQVIVYGASAWASVQEKKLVDEAVVTGRRRLTSIDEQPERPAELEPAELTATELTELTGLTELVDGELDAEPRPLFERGPVFQPKHA